MNLTTSEYKVSFDSINTPTHPIQADRMVHWYLGIRTPPFPKYDFIWVG